MSPLLKRNVTAFLKQNMMTGQKTRPDIAFKQESRADFPLPKDQFRRILLAEKKRAERASKSLLLLLLDHGKNFAQPEAFALLRQIAQYLSPVIRETDVAGWFDGGVLGVVFTEFGGADLAVAAKAIETKVSTALATAMPTHPLNKLRMTFYAFPDNWSKNGAVRAVRPEGIDTPSRGSDLREAGAFTQAATPGLVSQTRTL